MYNWKEKNHYNKYERASSFRIFVELISSLYFCIFFIFFFPYLLVSWFFYFGFSLVLAVGVIGNVLVILVLISYKSMRTSTNLFLLNLRCLSSVHQWTVWISCLDLTFLSCLVSIADLLVLIICCPNAMVEMYMRRVRSKLQFIPDIFNFKNFKWLCSRTSGWWGRQCVNWFLS